MRRISNWLRSTMGEERFSSLVYLNIECELTTDLVHEDLQWFSCMQTVDLSAYSCIGVVDYSQFVGCKATLYYLGSKILPNLLTRRPKLVLRKLKIHLVAGASPQTRLRGSNPQSPSVFKGGALRWGGVTVCSPPPHEQKPNSAHGCKCWIKTMFSAPVLSSFKSWNGGVIASGSSTTFLTVICLDMLSNSFPRRFVKR